MQGKLREIPDSVEEFTGFQKGFDILGGDFMGYGKVNEYRPLGSAIVRNVRLPANAPHTALPDTSDLLNDPQLTQWISHYEPGLWNNAAAASHPFVGKGGRILWAAEVWYDIKKHWVMELQRALRAGIGQDYGQ
jgi:hypothetical protein